MTRTEISDRRESNRRVKPRFINPPIACDQGQVLDLSADGLCIRPKRLRGIRQGDSLQLKLGELDVTTTVVWIKRGFGKRSVGLMFESMTPELRQMVSSVTVSAVSTITDSAGRGRAA